MQSQNAPGGTLTPISRTKTLSESQNRNLSIMGSQHTSRVGKFNLKDPRSVTLYHRSETFCAGWYRLRCADFGCTPRAIYTIRHKGLQWAGPLPEGFELLRGFRG